MLHALIVWSLRPDSDREIVEATLKGALAIYETITVFPNTVIIKVENTEDYKKIQDAVTSALKSLSPVPNFIMSPVMSGGRYQGLLPPTRWDEINKITG